MKYSRHLIFGTVFLIPFALAGSAGAQYPEYPYSYQAYPYSYQSYPYNPYFYSYQPYPPYAQPPMTPPSWSYDPYTSGLGPCPQRRPSDPPCSVTVSPTYGQPNFWR